MRIRTFFHKLATRFDAPLWVRARLLPVSETLSAQFEVSDPVEVFARDLGVNMRRRQDGGVVRRLMKGMWRWTAGKAFVTAATTTVAVALAPALTLALALVVALVVALALALVAAAVAAAVAAVVADDRSEEEWGKFLNHAFFLAFFGEMVVLWISSFFLDIPFAWVPLVTFSVLWVIGGIMEMEGGEEHNLSLDERLKEVVRLFVSQEFPGLSRERGLAEARVKAMNFQISVARDSLAKLDGEAAADKEHGGAWESIIEERRLVLEEGIDGLEAERRLLERALERISTEIQYAEAYLLHSATGLRVEEQFRRGSEALGLAKQASLEARDAVSQILLDVHEVMGQIAQAVENLQILTLSTSEGDVEVFIESAERIDESSVEAVRRLKAL